MPVKERQTLDDVLRRASAVLFPDLPPQRIDVNTRDADGDTPLHKAAVWGDNYAVTLLLDAGAAIDASGDMGCTPLYLAVSNSHKLSAQTLLERGANPDVRSELGFTARELAAKSGSTDLVDLFSA